MPSARAPISLPALTPEVRKVHKPVVIPDGVLDQQGTEKLWGRDRASLVQCEAGKAVLINYHDVLASKLAGADQSR